VSWKVGLRNSYWNWGWFGPVLGWLGEGNLKGGFKPPLGFGPFRKKGRNWQGGTTISFGDWPERKRVHPGILCFIPGKKNFWKEDSDGLTTKNGGKFFFPGFSKVKWRVLIGLGFLNPNWGQARLNSFLELCPSGNFYWIWFVTERECLERGIGLPKV